MRIADDATWSMYACIRPHERIGHTTSRDDRFQLRTLRRQADSLLLAALQGEINWSQVPQELSAIEASHRSPLVTLTSMQLLVAALGLGLERSGEEVTPARIRRSAVSLSVSEEMSVVAWLNAYA